LSAIQVEERQASKHELGVADGDLAALVRAAMPHRSGQRRGGRIRDGGGTVAHPACDPAHS
jgi:hypothetical protein